MKIYEANSEGSFPILLIFYAAKLIHLPRMPLRVYSGPLYTAELATIGAAGFSVVGSAMETAASCSGSC